MTQKDEFVEDMVRLLSSVLGDVQVRAMFGGHSFYHEGRVFAMTAGERLYFKADKLSSDVFEKAGSEPFTYDSHSGRPVAMSYWEAPNGTLDDPEAIRPWALLGVEAAARAVAKKKPKGK
jgi:DNA transformation protein